MPREGMRRLREGQRGRGREGPKLIFSQSSEPENPFICSTRSLSRTPQRFNAVACTSATAPRLIIFHIRKMKRAQTKGPKAQAAENQQPETRRLHTRSQNFVKGIQARQAKRHSSQERATNLPIGP